MIKRRIILLILASLVISLMFWGAPRVVHASTYADKVLALGPLAYWKLDETDGTTANDSSGNGHNGTYNGVTLNQIAGPGSSMGNAPLFDGINDYVNLYSSGLGTAFNLNQGSFSGWIRVYDASVWTDGGNRLGIYFARGFSNEIGVTKLGTNNTLIIRRDPAADASISESSTAWLHAGLTWSASGATAYLNGSPVGTLSYTALTNPITEAFLGAYQTSPGLNWSGYIAHVAVWTTVLNDSQMMDLADSNPPPTPTPTATATNTPILQIQMVSTLENGQPWLFDNTVTAGQIANFIPGLIMIALLLFGLILMLTRRQ